MPKQSGFDTISLRSYKGYEIFRSIYNGKTQHYGAYKQGTGATTGYTADTLEALKKKIDKGIERKTRKPKLHGSMLSKTAKGRRTAKNKRTIGKSY